MAEKSEAAERAIKRLEEFFDDLTHAEKEVISSLVRDALVGAASRYAGKQVSGYSIEPFVTALTGQNAPTLVRSLGLPGSLAAHSIPSCASSGLEAIRKLESAGR